MSTGYLPRTRDMAASRGALLRAWRRKVRDNYTDSLNERAKRQAKRRREDSLFDRK
jgi:hypothetical protein